MATLPLCATAAPALSSKLTALFLRTFCSKVTWDVLKLLFVEVSRAGLGMHTHTQGSRDMEDTPDAQQCVNSHLHKLVFTVKIRCPSPINRGHACSPRRIPGMALSHATGSRNRPLPPMIILWYIWVLTSVSAQQTSPHAHRSHHEMPSVCPEAFLAKAHQSCSQRSSQLVTPVYQ